MPEFCAGYEDEPFRTLAADFPGDQAYPPGDFRTEWGPVFHRGRLDGSARVLVIGQDPGQHENVLRRILVGEAGRRVQGFLAKLGIGRRYLMINALLYSVFGASGNKYVARPAVRDYRNRWIDAATNGGVQAIVAFGGMAKKAVEEWEKTPAGQASGLPAVFLTHPTFPESAGGTAAVRASNTRKMLAQWNQAIQTLRPLVQPDTPGALPPPYGSSFGAGDKVDIPSFDLPAGTPSWMYDNDGWARRIGSSVKAKRGNITITVPAVELP